MWVTGCLRAWFMAVRATVSVSDGMPGFTGYLWLLFFFNNKISFLLLFSVSLRLFGQGKVTRVYRPFQAEVRGI